MVKLSEQTANYVELTADGKVRAEDYKNLGPEIERVIDEHGPITMLVDLVNLDGFEPGAIVEDLKFDIKNATDIKRCAVVGDATWEKVMTTLYKPLAPKGEVKFFEASNRAAAKTWAKVEETA
jgi:hypothetical protein